MASQLAASSGFASSGFSPPSVTAAAAASVTSTPNSSSPSIFSFDTEAPIQTGVASGESAIPAAIARTTRNTPPAGVIAGIAIGILFTILLAGLCVWRIRRRQQQAVFVQLTRAASPFTLLPSRRAAPAPPIPTIRAVPENSDARSISASTIRQQYLRNEVRAAQEKLVDLGDLDRRTWSTSATRASASSRLLRMLSTRSASTTRTAPASPDLVAQLRERNEMLTARIRELEDQMESPWALGLSDEPPPGYAPSWTDHR
ncbi:hypothetical protein FB451DRAFT_1292656 [Mycena latifolia]|nr:hypothetical protein FB451DRAFT_1292656 [Mycena latifolia]